MVFIYTLQLNQGKYYVGKTSNPNFRIKSHFNLEGSEWTKEICYSVQNGISFQEIEKNIQSNALFLT
jgi:predicted GIY-YIG superfamily endonuclease